MKRISRYALTIGMATVSITSAIAAIPNTAHPTTTLAPTLQAGYTGAIDATTALNASAEYGANNYRFDATLGYALANDHRFKFTAEYFAQNLAYPFFAGNYSEWMNQFTVGGDYQYDFDAYLKPQVDIQAFYGHVANQNIGILNGLFQCATCDAPVPFADNQHVAGSNAYGVSPGLFITPWQGTKIGALLNYDTVNYAKLYSPLLRVTGLGGTAILNQAITRNIEFGITGAWLKPYNDYQANLTWSTVPDRGHWAVGLAGDYTVGKFTLPSSYNVMLTLNYFIDQRTPATHDGLLAYTNQPAVRLPEVLAVPDELVS